MSDICSNCGCERAMYCAKCLYAKTKEIERLKAEAKMGNISYKEAIALQAANKALKKEVERLRINLTKERCVYTCNPVTDIYENYCKGCIVVKHHKSKLNPKGKE